MPLSKDPSDEAPRIPEPPDGLDFWGLFDFFWVRGLGNELHTDGTPTPWTATSLELAFDGTPDKRTIENWQSQANMPSPDNIRKLSWVIAGEDKKLRQLWYEALIAARLTERRKEQARAKSAPEQYLAKQVATEDASQLGSPHKSRLPMLWVATGVILLAGALAAWMIWNATAAPLVANMRICDAPYFDGDTKKCTQHVSVFVHGVDEVFLSFDFQNVADGTPFDRWWILNGERVAGRTSFNDEAWPGYTYWRPGTLEIGQYVVRIVVEEQVFTQTFFVQPEGFPID